MKKLISCLAVLSFFVSVNAQDPSTALSTRAVYIEMGGPSVVYSFNYDFEFDRKVAGGWGARLGLGASAFEEFSFISLPVMVYYLLGKKESYFELSAGPIVNFGSGDVLYVDPDATPVIGSVYFGYRYQPADQGFLLRVGLPILIGVNSTYDWYTEQEVKEFYCLPYLPGVSVGYAF